MLNYFSTSLKIFILITCYAPLLNVYVPKTSFGAGLPDLDLVRLCIIILMISFFINILQAGRININGWILTIIAYSLVVIASVSWSKAYYYDAQMIASFFDMLFVPFFIAIVGLNVFQYEINRRKYAYHIMIAACFLSFISFYQYLFEVYQHQGVDRAVSTLGNPNLLAIVLVLWLPITLVSQRKKWISKKLSIIIQLIIFCAVVVTVSRKGIISWFLTYFLFFYFNKEKQKLIYLSVFTTIAAFVLLAYSVGIATRFSDAEIHHNVYGKWNMMVAALNMFVEKPWIGHGYNAYYENFGNMFRSSWDKKYDAHNEFASALANYGILGFFCFMVLFIIPLKHFFISLRRQPFKIYNREERSKKKIQISRSSDWLFHVMGIALIPPFMFNAFYSGALFKQPVAVITFFSQVAFALASNQYSKNIKKEKKANEK